MDGVGPLVLDAGDHPAVLRRLPGHLPAKVAAKESLVIMVSGPQEKTCVENCVGAGPAKVQVDNAHVLAQNRKSAAARSVI